MDPNYLSLFTLILGLFRFTVSRTVGYIDKQSCLQAPESVRINCQVINANSWECIEKNVVSIPVTDNLRNCSVLINCTAPYPIDLKVLGFQLHDTYETRFVRNAENVFNEATFVYSIGLIVDNLMAPRKVLVTKYNDAVNQMTFFMFRPKDQLFPSNMISSSSEPIIIEKSPRKMIIPCISADPYRSLELYPQNQQGWNQTDYEAMIYDKTQGFILDTEILTNLEGLYECKEKNTTSLSNSGNEKMSFQIIPRRNLVVEPTLKHIVLFKNDELSILCRHNRKIQLVGTLRGESIQAQTTVDVDFTSTFNRRNMKVGDTGKIDCVDEESKNILHSWTIETLDIYNNSQLQLEKIDNAVVACRSTTTEDVILQTLFCQGVSNCDLNKNCFAQGSNCATLRSGHPCKFQDGSFGSCVNFTQQDGYFSQGMIQCSAMNYSYTTKYLRGFDSILYLDWETAPSEALIDVRVPTNITMYPHNSYPFGCRASRFLSDGKIQWVIRGKDGSEILLHKNRVQDINATYNLDSDLYTVRESNIRLIYPNDYDILCMVPLWNATASLRNHKRINVAAKTAPVKEILFGSGTVIILLIIPLVYVIWRLKKAKEAIRNLTEQEVEEFVKGNPTALQQDLKTNSAHEVVDAIPYNRDFEIPREKLLIDHENQLGQGAFGLVLKGKVEGMSEIVAVKTVKPRCEVAQFKGFLSELKIMMYIGKHPFVVGLIGAHTDKIREKVIYIVVEYCVHGSLENILRNRNFVDQIQNNRINPDILTADNGYQNVALSDCGINSTSESLAVIKTVDLLRWSYEIATGMNYLTSKKVIHSDLAARNVLIHENGTAKITDFGLARQLFNYTQYVKKQQEPLPWRWMSIEALKTLTFSTQSDVWAYGVCLWELFSSGDVPYPGLAWTITFVEELTNGLRMVKPPHATYAIYEIMLNCWQENPASRPSFQFLSDCFRDMLITLNIEVKEPQLTSVATGIKNENSNSYENDRKGNFNLYVNDTK